MSAMNAGVMSTELATGQQSSEMNALEEELFTLNSVAPYLVEKLPGLFEEAVREALAQMLGMKESTGVLRWFHDADLGSRPEVFERLASRYGDRASPLMSKIDEAFERRVHNLLELGLRAQPTPAWQA